MSRKPKVEEPIAEREVADRLATAKLALMGRRRKNKSRRVLLYCFLAEVAKLKAFIDEQKGRSAAITLMARERKLSIHSKANPVILLFKLLDVYREFPPSTAARHARTVEALAARGPDEVEIERNALSGACQVLLISGRRKIRRRPTTARRQISRR